MKPEETEQLKLQYVKDVRTTISHINNIQEADRKKTVKS